MVAMALEDLEVWSSFAQQAPAACPAQVSTGMDDQRMMLHNDAVRATKHLSKTAAKQLVHHNYDRAEQY